MIYAMLRHPLRFQRDHRLTRRASSAYLDGELNDQERARIEQHTHVCPGCARMIVSLRRTLTALGALRETETSGEGMVADRVLRRLREER